MTDLESWGITFVKIGCVLFALGWTQHYIRTVAGKEARDAVNEHERWHDDHGVPEGDTDD